MALLTRLLIFFVLFSFNNAEAATNLFGAQIETRQVPTAAWRFGITGNKPIVDTVDVKSQAKNLGFAPGDIIHKLDGVLVKSSESLKLLKPGKHVLLLQRNSEQLEISFYIEEVRKQISTDSGNKENLPVVKANDDILENKYGKSEHRPKNAKRSYRECMEDEMARPDTYEFYLNNPNSGYGAHSTDRNWMDYSRAKRVCEKEHQGTKIIIINR